MGKEECPYLRRWTVETPWGSVRLHHWLASDDDRGFHDHPWWFLTLVLWGSYTDVSPAGRERMAAGRMRFRRATHAHTVEVDAKGCWSFLVTGPHTRFWGFWVGKKWIKSNKYFIEHGDRPCS